MPISHSFGDLLNVVAFEPLPKTIACLAASLKINELSNVYLYPYGLDDSKEAMEGITKAQVSLSSVGGNFGAAPSGGPVVSFLFIKKR